jgi:hypothetical protein
MEKSFMEQIEQLNQTTSNIDKTVGKILETIAKPPNRVATILNTVAAGVTILGILGIIELLIKWLGGD